MNTVTETKVHKTRTPKNPESVFNGAMKLSLGHKVQLRNKLSDAIESEVQDIRAAADQAEKLAGGNQ